MIFFRDRPFQYLVLDKVKILLSMQALLNGPSTYFKERCSCSFVYGLPQRRSDRGVAKVKWISVTCTTAAKVRHFPSLPLSFVQLLEKCALPALTFAAITSRFSRHRMGMACCAA